MYIYIYIYIYVYIYTYGYIYIHMYCIVYPIYMCHGQVTFFLPLLTRWSRWEPQLGSPILPRSLVDTSLEWFTHRKTMGKW